MVSAVMTDVSASAFLSFFMENTSVCFFICYIYYQTPVKKNKTTFLAKCKIWQVFARKVVLCMYVHTYIIYL